jgi:hypothetical protein
MSETLAALAKSRATLEEMLTRKAWEDDDFRQRFAADPKAMMAEYFGQPMPESLRVTVHEESPGDLHFVIPARPSTQVLDELSDADLEKVSGGIVLEGVLSVLFVTGVLGASAVVSLSVVPASIVSMGVTASAIATKASHKW